MIVYNDKELAHYMESAVDVSPDRPVLVDQFLEDATEIESANDREFSAAGSGRAAGTRGAKVWGAWVAVLGVATAYGLAIEAAEFSTRAIDAAGAARLAEGVTARLPG